MTIFSARALCHIVPLSPPGTEIDISAPFRKSCSPQVRKSTSCDIEVDNRFPVLVVPAPRPPTHPAERPTFEENHT